MKIRRNPNIEVLRVFAMFAIVVGHCCVHGVFKDDLVAWALAYMTIFSVDVFVFISGWYSICFSNGKFWRLLSIGLFAAVVVSAVSPMTLHQYSFVYSLGWFGNTYLGLMLVAPFLNAGVERLRNDNPAMLWSIWGIYGALLVFGWLPFRTVGFDVAPNGFSAFSIGLMAYVYLTGRILSGCEKLCRISPSTSLVCAVLCGVGTLALVVFGHFFKTHAVFGWLLDADLGAYSSPLVVSTAAFLFMTFLRLSIPRSVCRICLFLSPSMFSVYLLLDGCHGRVVWPVISMIERRICTIMGSGDVTMLLSIVVTAVVVFLVCVLIDLSRRGITGGVCRVWKYVAEL